MLHATFTCCAVAVVAAIAVGGGVVVVVVIVNTLTLVHRVYLAMECMSSSG